MNFENLDVKNEFLIYNIIHAVCVFWIFFLSVCPESKPENEAIIYFI